MELQYRGNKSYWGMGNPFHSRSNVFSAASSGSIFVPPLTMQLMYINLALLNYYRDLAVFWAGRVQCSLSLGGYRKYLLYQLVKL